MARDAPLHDAQHLGLVHHLIHRLDLHSSPTSHCKHHTPINHHHDYFINGETGILVAWGAEGSYGTQHTTKLFLKGHRHGIYLTLAPPLDWETHWEGKWLPRIYPEYSLTKRIRAWRTALAQPDIILDLRTRTALVAALSTYKVPKRLADAPQLPPLPRYNDPGNITIARHFVNQAFK